MHVWRFYLPTPVASWLRPTARIGASPCRLVSLDFLVMPWGTLTANAGGFPRLGLQLCLPFFFLRGFKHQTLLGVFGALKLAARNLSACVAPIAPMAEFHHGSCSACGAQSDKQVAQLFSWALVPPGHSWPTKTSLAVCEIRRHLLLVPLLPILPRQVPNLEMFAALLGFGPGQELATALSVSLHDAAGPRLQRGD